MAKHTLKILRCEHRKIFKVCLAILQIMHEKVKSFCGWITTDWQILLYLMLGKSAPKTPWAR